MTRNRRRVLGGLFVATGVLTALALADVLATVFFAVTVVYLLVPVRDALVARGLSPWWASLAATASVFVAVLLSVAPLFAVVALRADAVLAFLETVPAAVELDAFGVVYVVTVEQAVEQLSRVVSRLARTLVRVLPVFALKLTVFAMVVFGLCLHQRGARHAVIGVVPPSSRDVAAALDERVRSTLFAVYVLQAATAAATFALALPVFALLGYDIPVTLAVVAAALQFIPILGPSVLLAGLAAYHLLAGDVAAAALAVAVGGFFVAWLPDVLVRPRLARRTTGLSGTLYFVGFVGGILTLGVVGVVAGPLAIALLAEAASLLSEEFEGEVLAGD